MTKRAGSRVAWRVFFAALELLAIVSGWVRGTRAEGAEDKVFVGYLFGRSANIKWSLYTHVCHAFLTAEGDGSLNQRGGVPDPKLAAEAHKNGVKVLVSLGGWGWDDQFRTLTSKAESEDRYVKAVLDAVDKADYDGIDLDWEYPDTKEEVVGFERLSRRLRQGLDTLGKQKQRHMELTMAASSNLGTLSWLDRTFLIETMDWINVMTYDYTGNWTDYAGHHSPLFASSKAPEKVKRSTEATMNYLLNERKIPADRLAVGLPLYGMAFAVGEPYASKKGVAARRLPRGEYTNLNRLMRDEHWTRLWDDETKTPWLIAPDRSVVIGYDDAESIRLKTEWARQKGLRGVFFWQIQGDRLADGTNPLQMEAKKVWSGASKP